MMAWISANIWTILILLALVLIVGAAIFSLVRNQKKGKHSCGCGCANCAMRGECGGKR